MFFIKRNRNEFGPYNDKQIKLGYASGNILKRDLIRHDKTDKYISVVEFLKINKIQLKQNEESFLDVFFNLIKLKSVFVNPFKYLKRGGDENTILYFFLGILLIPVIAAFSFSSTPIISYYIYGLYFASIWALILYKLIAPRQASLKAALTISLSTIIISVILIKLFHDTIIWTKISGYLSSENLILSFTSMFFGVAIIEELLKQLFVYLVIFRERHVTMPRAAIFYGMIAGLSFGIFEGVEYQLTFNKTLDVNSNYFLNIIRLTSLPFFHAIWSGIGAYFASLSFVELNYKYSLRIMGLLIPSILHALYNISGINILGISTIIISSILLTVYLTKSDLVGKKLNNI